MRNKLQKQSILLLSFLSVITFGIYIPVWFLNRAEAFNMMNSKTKLNRFPLMSVIILFISSMIITVSVALSFDFSMFLIADGINMGINFIGGFIILIYSFSVREILEDHYNTNISAIATLLFTVFYLQYKINKLIDRSYLYESNVVS